MRTQSLVLSAPSLLVLLGVASAACSSSSSAGTPDAQSDVTVDVTTMFPKDSTVPTPDGLVSGDAPQPSADVMPPPTCATGLTYCAGSASCIDLTSTAAYCGSCTTGCPSTQVCSHSKCGCPTGAMMVGMVCVGPDTGVDAGVDSGVDAAPSDAHGDGHEDGHTGDAHADGHTGDAHEDGHEGDAHHDGAHDAGHDSGT